MDTVYPRVYLKIHGRNPKPFQDRPEMIIPGQNQKISNTETIKKEEKISLNKESSYKVLDI